MEGKKPIKDANRVSQGKKSRKAVEVISKEGWQSRKEGNKSG